MEQSYRAASAHSSRFPFLIAQFVDRRIPAEFFSTQFRELQNTRVTYLDAEVSSVIGMLSVDVGAYLGDVDLRGVDYIDAEQLWRAAGHAFRDLMTLQSEQFEREAHPVAGFVAFGRAARVGCGAGGIEIQHGLVRRLLDWLFAAKVALLALLVIGLHAQRVFDHLCQQAAQLVAIGDQKPRGAAQCLQQGRLHDVLGVVLSAQQWSETASHLPFDEGSFLLHQLGHGFLVATVPSQQQVSGRGHPGIGCCFRAAYKGPRVAQDCRGVVWPDIPVRHPWPGRCEPGSGALGCAGECRP